MTQAMREHFKWADKQWVCVGNRRELEREFAQKTVKLDTILSVPTPKGQRAAPVGQLFKWRIQGDTSVKGVMFKEMKYGFSRDPQQVWECLGILGMQYSGKELAAQIEAIENAGQLAKSLPAPPAVNAVQNALSDSQENEFGNLADVEQDDPFSSVPPPAPPPAVSKMADSSSAGVDYRAPKATVFRLDALSKVIGLVVGGGAVFGMLLYLCWSSSRQLQNGRDITDALDELEQRVIAKARNPAPVAAVPSIDTEEIRRLRAALDDFSNGKGAGAMASLKAPVPPQQGLSEDLKQQMQRVQEVGQKVQGLSSDIVAASKEARTHSEGLTERMQAISSQVGQLEHGLVSTAGNLDRIASFLQVPTDDHLCSVLFMFDTGQRMNEYGYPAVRQAVSQAVEACLRQTPRRKIGVAVNRGEHATPLLAPNVHFLVPDLETFRRDLLEQQAAVGEESSRTAGLQDALDLIVPRGGKWRMVYLTCNPLRSPNPEPEKWQHIGELCRKYGLELWAVHLLKPGEEACAELVRVAADSGGQYTGVNLRTSEADRSSAVNRLYAVLCQPLDLAPLQMK